MSRPRVLITGATGFVGRALVPALLDRYHVTILAGEKYGSGAPLPAPLSEVRDRLDVAYADLRNYQLTARAVRQTQPHRVIHLAAAGVTDPFLSVNVALRHNVTGTLNLLRACFEAEGQTTQQVIIARTPGERTAMNVYAASKAAAWAFCEMYARTAGWPICGAMIFQAYGPGQPDHLFIPAALRAAAAGADFPMTSGGQRKDWIHIDDVVGGLAALLAADLPPGTTLELGSGRPLSLLEVAERIYALAGRGGRPLPGVLPNRPGEETLQAADVERAARLLGWRPSLSLEEGLARLAADATAV